MFARCRLTAVLTEMSEKISRTRPAQKAQKTLIGFCPSFLGIKSLYKRKTHSMLKAGPAEDATYIANVIMVNFRRDGALDTI